jgi:hypothetical protein
VAGIFKYLRCRKQVDRLFDDRLRPEVFVHKLPGAISPAVGPAPQGNLASGGRESAVRVNWIFMCEDTPEKYSGSPIIWQLSREAPGTVQSLSKAISAMHINVAATSELNGDERSAIGADPNAWAAHSYLRSLLRIPDQKQSQ